MECILWSAALCTPVHTPFIIFCEASMELVPNKSGSLKKIEVALMAEHRLLTCWYMCDMCPRGVRELFRYSRDRTDQ